MHSAGPLQHQGQCLSQKRQYDRGNSYKKESWGLAYSFRGLVHYRYGREHDPTQLGMVLDMQLRATSWSTESRRGERATGPGMSF